MLGTSSKFIGVVVFTVLFTGVATEARAQNSRQTPLVVAVKKTRDAVVVIKVEKTGVEDPITGTGVVVDERGYIVTSCHVVAGANEVRVQFVDKTNLKATVLVADPKTDLAVLRVDAGKSLKFLPLGPGSDLMVAETVFAAGHPRSYEFTVTSGIISALGRRIGMPTGHKLTNLIQFSAPINPGNSGGPLLNINGELIGIVAAIPEDTQGIAFAVNIETVKEVLSRHLSSVKVAGVSHGLTCSEKVENERQTVVTVKVASDSPAAVAGLKQGDTIVRVGQKTVSNRFDVERALWGAKPGQKITLNVLREGTEKNVAITLTAAN